MKYLRDQGINAALIDTFEKGIVWLAIKSEVEDRMVKIRKELEFGVVEDPKTGDVIELSINGIKERQGELCSLRWIADLPDILLEILKGEEETKDEQE